MMQSAIEKQSSKRSMRRKSGGIAESGTCNVCSAPCSSCMHLKLGCVPKPSEISDETTHMAAPSQNSINDFHQCTASEASNLVSVSSSHDSLSENAESKVEVRSADVSLASIESKTLLKLETEGIAGVEPLPSCLPLEKRSGSKSFGDSKVAEGLDDNISCVSKAKDDSSVVSYNRKTTERKTSSPKSDLHGGSGSKECGEAESIAVNGGKLTDGDSCNIYLSAKCEKEKDTLKAEDKDGRGHMEEAQPIKGIEEKKVCVHTLNVQAPALQSVSGDESYESDVVEHDVKVCDICGDTGREDLLAICSRCTDGAEHTYCMREMLQKIPEGDWLCEECKSVAEIGKQKQADTPKREIGQKYGNRHSELTELQLPAKRHASETTSGSPAPSRFCRTAALSREILSKSFDRERVKSTDPSSPGNQPTGDHAEASNSQVAQPLNRKGLLSKSSSFNTVSSKTNSGLADEVSGKVIGSRGSSSATDMEGPRKLLSKSMSFKSVTSGRALSSEAKVRMLPSKFSHVADTKGGKPITDKNALERKSLPRLDQSQRSSLNKIDQKLNPRAENSMKSSLTTSKDNHAKRLDGKSGNLSRSNSFLARKGSDIHVLPVRTSLANDSIDPRYQPSPKDEPSSSTSWIAEKPSNNENETFPDCLPKSKDQLIQGERTKESSSSRLKPSDVISSKKEVCQTCKEVGHGFGNCKQVSRGELSTGSKLKAAIEAAILKKPGIYRKKRENEQHDGPTLSHMDFNLTLGSTDMLATTNKIKESNPDEDTTEGKSSSVIMFSESSKQQSDKHVKQNTSMTRSPIQGGLIDSSVSVKAEDVDYLSHAFGKSGVLTTVPPVVVMPSAIPEHDWIWQGTFEVCKSSGYVECCGIQAHLSTFASPKVLDVVKQFPNKLTLDEVPRSCAWPSQFRVNGAKEENIALFFFAKDVGSFEKHYKGLLDSTIQNDFALKGSFDGVDLLIYPSDKLPENSQRWNMLYFLWGVFHGRKPDCSEALKKAIAPVIDITSSEKDKLDSASIISFKSTGSPEPADKEQSLQVDVEAKPAMENEHPFLSTDDQVESCRTKGDPQTTDSSFKVCSNGGAREASVDGGVGVQRPAAAGTSGEKSVVKVETNLHGRDLNTPAMETWLPSSKKRPFLDLSEEAPQSFDRPKDIQLNSVPSTRTDDESVSKKPKTAFSDPQAANSPREDICDSSSISLPAEKSTIRYCDEEMGTNERYFFFPIESRNAKDSQIGPNPMLWKDNTSSEASRFAIPNLDLALGAERSPGNRGILPSLAGPRRSRTPEKKSDECEDDGVSASLSLSLSFPFPEKEQTAKPELKSEEVVHGKCNVNTSLFLFGGFSGKQTP